MQALVRNCLFFSFFIFGGIDNLFAENWLRPMERPFELGNVDVIPQRQWWSASQLGYFQFHSWLEVDFSENQFRSVIGRTRKGELFQIVQLDPHKFVGRKLSGQRCIRDFALHEESGRLIAVDCDGHWLYFDHSKWVESPLPRFVRGAAIWWAEGLILAWLGMGLYGPEWLTDNPLLMSISEAYLALFGAAIASVIAYWRFEPHNRNPDGFNTIPILENSSDPEAWDRALNALPTGIIKERSQWEGPCEDLLLPRPNNSYLNRQNY